MAKYKIMFDRESLPFSGEGTLELNEESLRVLARADRLRSTAGRVLSVSISAIVGILVGLASYVLMRALVSGGVPEGDNLIEHTLDMQFRDELRPFVLELPGLIGTAMALALAVGVGVSVRKGLLRRNVLLRVNYDSIRAIELRPSDLHRTDEPSTPLESLRIAFDAGKGKKELRFLCRRTEAWMVEGRLRSLATNLDTASRTEWCGAASPDHRAGRSARFVLWMIVLVMLAVAGIMFYAILTGRVTPRHSSSTLQVVWERTYAVTLRADDAVYPELAHGSLVIRIDSSLAVPGCEAVIAVNPDGETAAHDVEFRPDSVTATSELGHSPGRSVFAAAGGGRYVVLEPLLPTDAVIARLGKDGDTLWTARASQSEVALSRVAACEDGCIAVGCALRGQIERPAPGHRLYRSRFDALATRYRDGGIISWSLDHADLLDTSGVATDAVEDSTERCWIVGSTLKPYLTGTIVEGIDDFRMWSRRGMKGHPDHRSADPGPEDAFVIGVAASGQVVARYTSAWPGDDRLLRVINSGTDHLLCVGTRDGKLWVLKLRKP